MLGGINLVIFPTSLLYSYIVNDDSNQLEKSMPVVRQGRKANGSRISGTEIAGLPGCRVSAHGADRKEQ
jgi:hypothetical protein